jgi:hypothetical protein
VNHLEKKFRHNGYNNHGVMHSLVPKKTVLKQKLGSMIIIPYQQAVSKSPGTSSNYNIKTTHIHVKKDV